MFFEVFIINSFLASFIKLLNDYPERKAGKL